jgi:hypothetical protein
MLKIGDIVQNRLSKDYGTIAYSSFGFSIHMYNDMGGLSKTLGLSEDEILKLWNKVEMPKGYMYAKHGGIRKIQADELYVFLETTRSSVGGNAIGTTVRDIDNFIETYKDVIFGYSVPDIRPIKINSRGGNLLKDLEVEEFEQLFSGRVASMNKLLWYYPTDGGTKSRYPLFRKSVYLKYGTPATKHFDKEKREYYAMAIDG